MESNPEIEGYTFDYGGEDPAEVDKRLAEEDTRKEAEKEEKVKREASPKKPDKIRFECSCGKTLAAPVERAGAKARCPKCRKPVVVPTPDVEEDDDKRLEALFGYGEGEDATELTCEHCGADMAPGAIVCVGCGINRMTGAQLATATGVQAEIPGEGGSLLEKVTFWKKKPDKSSYRTISEDRGIVPAGKEPAEPEAESSESDEKSSEE